MFGRQLFLPRSPLRARSSPFDAHGDPPYAAVPSRRVPPTDGVPVDITSPSRGWWGFQPIPPPPRSIVELIRGRTLDAELAGLLWLLVEARQPIVVAAERGRTGKTTLLQALLDFLPPGTKLVELAGIAETFEWLPHARELGWRGPMARHAAA